MLFSAKSTLLLSSLLLLLFLSISRAQEGLIDIGVEIDGGAIYTKYDNNTALPPPFAPEKYNISYNLTMDPCRPGHYCLDDTAVPCPPGSYSKVADATSLEDCVTCPLKTYSPLYGQTTVCPLCPINHACPNASSIIPCPQNTVSTDGNTNVLDCVCLANYDCTIRKQLVVKLEIFPAAATTNNDNTEPAALDLAQFQNNTELILELRQAIAQTEGVNVSRVIFKRFRVSETQPSSAIY
jgi:hypothetical protein